MGTQTQQRVTGGMTGLISNPKQTRVPGEMSIRLTQRDVEILTALHTSRYMTAPQIATLFWRETKPGTKDPEGSRLRASQRRLRQLTKEQLIRRIEVPVKMGEGRKPYIYTLDKQAVPILQSVGVPKGDIDWKRKPAEENYPFLDHLLATNELRIALMLACEGRLDVELYRWVDEKELKSDPDRVEIKHPRSGKTERVAVVPDAHFVLRRGRKGMFFLAEIDRATVTVAPTKWEQRGWTKKVRAYRAYYHDRTQEVDGQRMSLYQKRYNTNSLRILTVTSSLQRLENLKEATERVGGDARFWFTTFDQLAPDTVLTGRIWVKAGSNTPVTLID